jgi:hypothetical protein
VTDELLCVHGPDTEDGFYAAKFSLLIARGGKRLGGLGLT